MLPSMDLYLVRHAIAEPRDGRFEDAQRPLTLEGMERFERSVKGLGRARIEFDGVLHSPWRRAVETAQRLAPLLGSGRREETEELSRPPRDELLQLVRGDSQAIVGHQPWLAELLAWLCVGERELSGAFALKKGGVAWLSGDPEPGACVVRAIWTPRSLRRMAD